VAKLPTNAVEREPMSGHSLVSWRRLRKRRTWMPKRSGARGEKRSVAKGMRSSAVQPSAPTRTSAVQTPSQA